ncbi:MAG: hypothetical protein M3P29_02230 [Acidobacteriota bacterium]|nr:hypothetical protein [Acidobacteriota bacterium]
MKLIAIPASLALVALSLYAAEPQAQGKDDAKSQAATHSPTLFSATETVGIGDSPLVRAAKASRRPGKKSSIVITNETLVRTGGHFTTTTPEAQQPLPTVRPGTDPSWDQMAADARRKTIQAAAAAAEARKAEDQKRIAAARSAALMEGDTPESTYNEPPALEGTMQQLKPTTPSTTGQQPRPPL